VVVDKAAGIFADADKIHAIHHVGTHFSVRGPLTAVRPVQGHPVIVVSDMSAPGQHLAAGFADIFVASCQSLDQATALANDLRGQAVRRGRAPGALRILATISPILAGSNAEAQARAARLDALLGTDGDASTAMPGLRFVGTAEGLCELMAAWHAAGACDGFNLAPAVLQDDLGQLIDGVIPRLQQRGLFRTEYGSATLREHLALPRPLNSFSGMPVHG
jgi:alkanesulfonate monooxygenase SsuD/methylene tetrahydromethanopterin reductase-like flavin-dependent oxidoreductase (luciferase family)